MHGRKTYKCFCIKYYICPTLCTNSELNHRNFEIFLLCTLPKSITLGSSHSARETTSTCPYLIVHHNQRQIYRCSLLSRGVDPESTFFLKKGRHCCSVGELKITFASTCKESVFNVLFNVLFLVLDFPLGAPNTLLKHVIERSIWRIVVGEGSWWGWGFSQDW